MSDTLPQSAAPAIVGWVLQVFPPGDGFHHAVVAIADSGDFSVFCGPLVPHTAKTCFHAGRDRQVTPRCPQCDAAAGEDRQAQGVRELALSATYSRHG